MRARHSEPPASAQRVRSLLERGPSDPSLFRAALASVPPIARDAWVNDALGLGVPPDDGPELPRGCVPYLPCAVDVLLRLVEHAAVRPPDVFVDIGSGVGRAAALVNLLTGARAVGVEVQPALASAARELATRLHLTGVSFVEGDAVQLPATASAGSVFLLYCPFGGERLVKLLAQLEPIARTRVIRVCCVDLPLPPCAWLELVPPLSGDLAIHESTGVDAGMAR